MKLIQTTAFTLVTLLSGLTLQACSPKASNSVEMTCMQTDISARCIAENAEQVLASINDPFNWTTSAVELAIAQDKLDKTQTALSLFATSVTKAEEIEDTGKRATAYGDIALALAEIQKTSTAIPIIEQLTKRTETVESEDKKWDILGKLITARAVHGDKHISRDMANAMPKATFSQDAYRGRTQREIAGKLAKSGDFDTAFSLINIIDADFTYYGAIARTDVAALAVKAGREDLATSLFEDAKTIANMQENGYFSGAILRDIGYTLVRMDEMDQANKMFDRALEKARNAKSDQEKARAISRIATRLSDCGLTEHSSEILTEALSISRRIDSQQFTIYTLYEIAGSAAFSGEFDLSKSLITEIPDTKFSSAMSLKAASQRDLAWGLARAQKVDEAISLANAITSPREKVQALSRIIRVLKDPEMRALPRYL